MILKDWLSRCYQNKRKKVAPHVTHLICSLVLLFTISLKLITNGTSASAFHLCLLSVFTSLLRITFAVLQKPCQGNFGKFQGSGWRFWKRSLFLKIPKCQHKFVRYYNQWKLDFYFLNNAAKTCLYGLKISGKIEIEHDLQSEAFFFTPEQIYMTSEVNSNRFEVSLRGKTSLRCKVTSLSAFTWPQAKWNSLQSIWTNWNFKPQWVFHANSKCPQWNKVAQNH